MEQIVGYTKDGQPVRVQNMTLQRTQSSDLGTSIIVLGVGALVLVGVVVAGVAWGALKIGGWGVEQIGYRVEKGKHRAQRRK